MGFVREQRLPGVGQIHDDLTTVRGMRRALDKTELGERSNNARQRRRLHFLTCCEYARSHRAVLIQARQGGQLRQRYLSVDSAAAQMPGETHYSQGKIAGQRTSFGGHASDNTS